MENYKTLSNTVKGFIARALLYDSDRNLDNVEIHEDISSNDREEEGEYFEYEGLLNIENIIWNIGFHEGYKKSYYESGVLQNESCWDAEKAEFIGLYKAYYESGELMGLSIFSNDAIASKGYFENGNLKFEGIRTKSDQKIGIWKFYYENGNLSATGSYDIDGNENGLWQQYYESGEIKSVTEEGSLERFTTNYYESGEISSQGMLDDEGYKLGEWITYNPSGDLLSMINFEDCEKKYKVVRFYPSGNLMSEVDYIDYILDGLTRYYHESGFLEYEISFHAGNISLALKYDENGNAIKAPSEDVDKILVLLK